MQNRSRSSVQPHAPQRGPRGQKVSREENQTKGLGDCIDCNLCVQVCPTGIDIRNGLQYECINCGACVDACNDVMEKMNYPKGLISFTSETELAGGKTKIFRPKLIGYGIVLLLMSGLLVFDIATRKPLEIDIIKDRVPMYRETGNGLIENVFTLKILNKSQYTQRYHIYIDNLEGHTYIGEDEVTVSGGEVFNLPLSIAINPNKLTQESTAFSFRVESIDAENTPVTVQEISKFLYPNL